MEIEYAYLSKRPTFKHEKPKTATDLSQYRQQLLTAYEDYRYNLNAKNQKLRSEYERKKEAFKNKKCLLCGAKLKLITAYTEFWGCPNYKDGREHSRFNSDGKIHFYIVKPSSVWIIEILELGNLRDKLKAKETLAYLLSIGLEDLRLTYGRSDTMRIINTLVETNKRSKEQESYAFDYLQTIYPKVIPQQCIIYKLKGQKETFCIPDFICSSDFEVMVCDAKLDYVDNEKMDKYVALVAFITQKHKDDRPVNGSFFMYDLGGDWQYKTDYQIFKVPPWEIKDMQPIHSQP